MTNLRRVMFLTVFFLFCTNVTAKDQKPEKGPEVVTITDMQMGDAACYLSFKDAKNKVRHADASHMLCNDTSLLNRKATITYIQANIIAAHCEGDPACPDTETVWIVDAAKLMTPKDLCQKDEVFYQGCDTTTGNMISFCTKEKFKNNFEKTPAYLVLRYGSLKKVSMEVASQSKKVIETRLARYAGSNTRFVLRWQHEGQTYFFESAYIDDNRLHGMSRYGKGNKVSFETCKDHRPGHQRFTEPHEYEDL